MSKILKEAKRIKADIDVALKQLNFQSLNNQLSKYVQQSTSSDFWENQEEAKDIMQKISKLNNTIVPWNELIKKNNDLIELAEMSEDDSEELEEEIKSISEDFASLKLDLRFNHENDNNNVIMTISAGAGGTDAQDWAEMLYRMYFRYAEDNKYSATILSQSRGEEAGIKSVTLEIDGKHAYGKLKGENGVHRLVRLSPFNSDNLRQTSFAKVEIIPKIDQPKDVEIDEKEIKIDVFRSGGHGGQSVNTTDSAVRVTHLPTGITVSIQNERSQIQNRELAMTILRSKLAKLRNDQHVELLSELKGPNLSAEWGNQIRSYVLHPYKQVKDLRTGYESTDPEKVLDGKIEPLLEAFIEKNISLKE